MNSKIPLSGGQCRSARPVQKRGLSSQSAITPFGSIDGIALIYILTRSRPEFKVMVNMILNKLSAMRPNFIAVDQAASPDEDKRRVSVSGIREAISMLKSGKPVGFFRQEL